ncbi:Uncharacterised protein [Vibrio cholerae]|nr:Uncharacterised protein [Vibrio cholerae]
MNTTDSDNGNQYGQYHRRGFTRDTKRDLSGI